MPITFACSGCAKQFKVPEEMAGRSTRCTQCGNPLVVPGSAGAITTWPSAPQPIVPAAPPPVPGTGISLTRRFALSRKALMTTAGGIAAFVLLGAMVWGGYKLVFGPSGLGDEVRYFPDNTQLVASIRPEQIQNSEVFKALRKELPDKAEPEKDIEQATGIPVHNMQQVVLGFAAAPDNQHEYVVVVKTVKAVTADELKGKKTSSPQETKVQGVSLYDHYGFGWCLPDSRTVVISKTETLRKVLERNRSAQLSDGLRAALKYADFSRSAAMATDSKETYSRLKDTNKKSGIDFEKMLEQVGIANPMGDIEAAAYQVDVAKDIRVQSVLLCKDAKTAEDMKKISDGMAVFLRRLFPKYGADSLETWESSVSSNRLHSSVTVKTDSILKGIQGIKEVIGKKASALNQ